MRRVLQTKKGECGIAAIAMIGGLSLDEAHQAAHDALGHADWGAQGLTDEEIIRVLREALGIPARDGPDWTSLEDPALLICPSLNHRGLLHYVVWDPEAEQYLDPSPGPLVYPDDGPYILVPDGTLIEDPSLIETADREIFIRLCWARAIVW